MLQASNTTRETNPHVPKPSKKKINPAGTEISQDRRKIKNDVKKLLNAEILTQNSNVFGKEDAWGKRVKYKK